MRRLLAVFSVSVLVLLAGCTGSDNHDGHSHSSDGEALTGGKTRTYYIASDEVTWNYTPQGKNVIKDRPFIESEKVFVEHRPDRIGSTYLKCLYRAYTDKTFSTRVKIPAAEAYLGNLGPTIRAEVGDNIKVVFKNNCSFPTSIHPHGVFYKKNSEGAEYNDGTGDADKHDGDVATNHQVVYHWKVPERAGPAAMDGSSAMWMYHSHSDEIGDVYAGLSGFMVVTAKGKAKADGSPKDVDQEVFSLFEVNDENQSPLLDANLKKYVTAPPAGDDEAFEESNLMHNINGYVYGNGPVVTLKHGSKVRWYLMGMGTEVDLHTPHWHGNTVTALGMRTDVVSLLPATMMAVDMAPDDVGTWLFHCHVGDHIVAGMQAMYRVV